MVVPQTVTARQSAIPSQLGTSVSATSQTGYPGHGGAGSQRIDEQQAVTSRQSSVEHVATSVAPSGHTGSARQHSPSSSSGTTVLPQAVNMMTENEKERSP